jgi:hypothetical protein
MAQWERCQWERTCVEAVSKVHARSLRLGGECGVLRRDRDVAFVRPAFGVQVPLPDSARHICRSNLVCCAACCMPCVCVRSPMTGMPVECRHGYTGRGPCGDLHAELCTAHGVLHADCLFVRLHCSALHCNAMQCNAMQCNAMQYNAMQCNAMQCNALRTSGRAEGRLHVVAGVERAVELRVHHCHLCYFR